MDMMPENLMFGAAWSPFQLLLVLLVVVLLFGKGKVSDLMGDVAMGIKSFKKGMAEDETPSPPARSAAPPKPLDHEPARTEAGTPTGNRDEGLRRRPAQMAENAPAPSPSVRIDNFSFTPAEITIAPGTTLTWVNGDDIPHTVAATNKAFRSKVMDTDQHYSFTFTAPGTYEYFCSLHPHMQGKVIVK